MIATWQLERNTALLTPDPQADEPLLILIPVFNDWSVVSLLLPKIDAALQAAQRTCEVLLVDDGSTLPAEGALNLPDFEAIQTVDILELARNLGHQRAIAIGLTWIRDHRPTRTVVVTDGDGEDNPADIPRLLERFDETGKRKIVFGARTRRSEHWTFQVGYRSYQLLHLVLTGQRVRVGNFSVIPPRAVARLAVISEVWNHYAAAVFNSRIEYDMVPSARCKRLGGASKMNFISLVVHGLSALSIFSHVIGVRLLIATMVLICGTLVGFGLAAGMSAIEGQSMPAWIPLLMILMLAILAQQAFLAVAFILQVLSSRQGTSFVPLRDYHCFVAQLHSVYRRS
ncbi:Undecaprenyl-phosphate 4-deoxy-4-formamido-L-arabinose transferase [Anatilimnocola aggregata]|uniref:Undecaprenyl-phosphate 4-deoxy-4-formamido-L-arabinose transferase n=1 Tax=Anatilimnocola aggregata TaxID=2528021 RepID=A0A517Y809_9BACT|nr:glycosyltransferase [Anatilimnocola aggregata]QDU26353.1 Undecaprenyl-phosphate 4-deoxy-4-formamido-L-arabinose transferase [Anatilimnocola aggregata]